VSATVVRLIGVYDADGTLRGELSYWIGARMGRAHCSLCDITHGLFRERADWRSCRSELPVPFETFHRDDQPDSVRRAVNGKAPVVVAETDDAAVHLLLDNAQIEACAASPDALIDAITTALAQAGLR
jgi:hypothetical protein